MADGTHESENVRELLAQLRSKMSQLDDMFPLRDEGDAEKADAHEEQTSALPFEHSLEETLAPNAAESKATDVTPARQDSAEDDMAAPSENAMALSAQAQSDNEVAEDGEAALSSLDMEEPLYRASSSRPASPETEEDASEDTIVFEKGGFSSFLRRESLTPAEVITPSLEHSEKEDTMIVEGEHPLSHDGNGESFFLVSEENGEDTVAPIVTDEGFLSEEERFDPERYNRLLREREARMKAEEARLAEEESLTQEERRAQEEILTQEENSLQEESPAQEESFVQEESSAQEERAVQEEEPSFSVLEEHSEENGENTSPFEPEEMIVLDETPVQHPLVTPTEVFEPIREEAAVLPEEELAMPEAPETPETPEAQDIPRTRVLRAEGQGNETDRTGHPQFSSPRVHLAPKPYRAQRQNEKSDAIERASADDEEDYLGGLPQSMRHHLSDYPLGHPNRVKHAADEPSERSPAGKKEGKKKKKRLSSNRLFQEEKGESYDENGASDYMRERLQEELRHARVRLVSISIFAILLLFLENITRVTDRVPAWFIDSGTAGYADAFLLLGAMIAAWPRMATGAAGFRYRRILPESILFVQAAIGFLYAIVFAVLEIPVLHFSFVPALSLAILYCFRVLHCENRLQIFARLSATGEKLVFSPTPKAAMKAETNVLGWSLDGDAPLMYRVRKTSFIDGFVRRTGAVCEDERLNFGLLLTAVGVSVAAGVVAFVLKESLVSALQSAVFALFTAAPSVLFAAHIYPMRRTLQAAGEDSAVLGEKTVREVAALDAVAFEDIEASPSRNVTVSSMKIYAGDPTTVLSYVTALFRTVGGPLCGYFSSIDRNASERQTAVELVDATCGGLSAVVNGAEMIVGDGDYMEKNETIPPFDAEDAKELADGKTSIMYVAINGKVCAKFYVRYRISSAFEKNVVRLHKLGVATIIRTYDPNFTDKTVMNSSALSDCRVHVIGKTVDQQNDFAAPHVEGGLVTSAHSGKLLQLLFLCVRSFRALVGGWVLKLIAAVLGGVLGIAVAVLGAYSFVPSVYIGLYHLVMLLIGLLFVRLCITAPKISDIGRKTE